MATQRDMMRRLYRDYGGDRESVIRAYVAAESKGLVDRASDVNDHSPERYARFLWDDGFRKGWIREWPRRDD